MNKPIPQNINNNIKNNMKNKDYNGYLPINENNNNP